jgi:parallel beta-helix repeat protein
VIAGHVHINAVTIEEISSMKHTFVKTGILLLTLLLTTIATGTGPQLMTVNRVSSGNLIAQTYTDHAAIWINGNSDFLVQAVAENWTGDGSEGNPLTITGYRIDDTTTECIKLENVYLHWVISDCLLEGGPPDVTGLSISNVSNGEVSNNIIRDRNIAISGVLGIVNCSFIGNQLYDNAQNAIKVLNGMADCAISGNYLDNNLGNQMWITGGFNDSVISDNTVQGGNNGIRINGCLRSIIQGNTICETVIEPIMLPLAMNVTVSGNTILSPNTNGIMLSGDNHVISSNNVDNCSGYGIYLASGDFGAVHDNIVSNCTDYGLRLSATTANTTVEENVFIDNNAGGCQVLDDGEDNEFCYNHFNDWVSPDEDLDNVVDEAYCLDGDAENTDLYPLVDPDGGIPVTTTTGTTDPTGIPMGALPILAIGVVIAVIVVVLVMKQRR